MANTKISALTAITDAVHGDALPIVDTSAGSTKKVDFSEIASPNKGVISVHSDDATQIYRATADGSTDDRAVILSAFTYAVANMPCVVEFGPGDYAISGGIEVKPAQGESGLSIRGAGANVTRIKFAKGSALIATQYIAIKIIPSSVPTVGVWANYLRDITIEGIGFFDNDPATHQSAGPEESHGVAIHYAVNVNVRNCVFVDIGDEGAYFSNVVSGAMCENYAENTPSIGTYGGALSIGRGCKSINVSNNVLFGTGTPGTISTIVGQGGIDISLVAGATATDIEDIVIADNLIHDFTSQGVLINCADTTNNSDIRNIVIVGNKIGNCSSGIARRGSSGVTYKISCIGNIITDIVDDGIVFDVAANLNYDVNLSFNIISDITNTSGRGVLCNGTRLNLSGNVFQDIASYAIYMFVADEIVIQGGVIDSCGGTSVQCIKQQTAANTTLVSGVMIRNALSTSSVVSGCSTVSDCIIEQATPSWSQVSSAKTVTGNRLNGGIRTTGNNCIISNNHIVTSANLNGDGIELTSQTDCIVSNNYIEVSFANRVGIDANNACDYCIFTGNNTRNSSISGRAYLTTNSNIIEANNQPAFTDRG